MLVGLVVAQEENWLEAVNFRKAQSRRSGRQSLPSRCAIWRLWGV